MDNPLDAQCSMSIVSYDLVGAISQQEGGSQEAFNEKLMAEMKMLDADVLCFQSVTVDYWTILETSLNELGYTGVMKSRRPGEKAICETLFYRENKFHVIGRWTSFLDELIVKQSRLCGELYHPAIEKSVESPEVAILAILRCKTSQRNFWVVNTRCASQLRNRADLQSSQVCSIIKELTALDAELPVILCGNFDFQPQSDQYQIIQDGYMRLPCAERLAKIKSIVITEEERYPLSIIYGSGFTHPKTRLRSAYKAALSYEPPNLWTKESDSLLCCSYIWFSEDQLTIKAVLNINTSELPSVTSDSNSVALKAVFQFHDEVD